MAESFVKTKKGGYIRHMSKVDHAKTLSNLAIAVRHSEGYPYNASNTDRCRILGVCGRPQFGGGISPVR